MLKCKNLSKSLNGKLRCKLLKQQVTLLCYKNCSQFILERNKPIKKVSKKVSVTALTYNTVLKRDKICQLCDKTCNGRLELHHIRYRKERKDLINEPSNCIMLCTKHHKQVHSNKHYWQPILLEKVKGNKNVSNQ